MNSQINDLEEIDRTEWKKLFHLYLNPVEFPYLANCAPVDYVGREIEYGPRRLIEVLRRSIPVIYHTCKARLRMVATSTLLNEH